MAIVSLLEPFGLHRGAAHIQTQSAGECEQVTGEGNDILISSKTVKAGNMQHANKQLTLTH